MEIVNNIFAIVILFCLKEKVKKRSAEGFRGTRKHFTLVVAAESVKKHLLLTLALRLQNV